MKPFKLITIAVVSMLILSGCEYYYSNEVVTEMAIEKEEYYKKGKLYSNLVYVIKTDEREYRVVDTGVRAETVYYSYNVGDKVTFASQSDYTIIKNKRK